MEDPETKDREKMLAEASRIKEEMYSYMLYLSRLNLSELSINGFLDLKSALIVTLKRTEQRLNKLTEDHIKKYPDA